MFVDVSHDTQIKPTCTRLPTRYHAPHVLVKCGQIDLTLGRVEVEQLHSDLGEMVEWFKDEAELVAAKERASAEVRVRAAGADGFGITPGQTERLVMGE